MAAQVEPSLSEKETTTLFIDTFREAFYDKMIGCTSSKFSDIVVIVERVERDMRKWRIDSPRATNSKTLPSGTRKKKEGNTNAMMFHSTRAPN